MDDLDRKILSLLAKNARMPVKEIAEQVSLTSPAVSSRIHRLEQEGIIGGYTVVLRHPDAPARVEALISVLVVPSFWNCRIRCSGWGMLPQLTMTRKV